MFTKSFSRKTPPQSTFARLFLLALGLLLAAAATVRADTFYVNNIPDLIKAIKQANGGKSPDTIILEKKVYIVTAGDSQYPENAFPKIRSWVTIKGNGAEIVRPNNGTVPAFRFFEVENNEDAFLFLYDLILRGGQGYRYGGALLNRRRLTVERCFLIGNQAVDSDGQAAGGALYNDKGRVWLKDSTLFENRASFGGGFGSEGSVAPLPHPLQVGQVEITRSAIWGNSAMNKGWGARGGGVFLRGAHLITIADSTVTQNHSQVHGGGFAFDTVQKQSPAGPNYVRLRNLTVVNNQATWEGGGFYYTCGAVCATALAVEMGNTIVTNNNAPANRDFGGNGVYQSLGHNIIGLGVGFNNLGSDTIEPALTKLTWVGYLLPYATQPGRQHYRLEDGSLALNNGDPAYCSPTDQLGQPRVGTCDSGAVEKQ